jgi:hypothetical protein
MHVRVYHPETGEAFDVTRAKADHLVLEKGWLQTPLDPVAEPAVVETPKARGRKPVEVEEPELPVADEE